MLPGQRFELAGDAVFSGGRLHQETPDGELNLIFTSAKASWVWRGETLDGALSLTMAGNGQARANFQLPVMARFPVAFNPKGLLRASLVGQFQEKGIVTALFPGFVRESSGELDAKLDISGTWEVPLIGGKLQLAKASAYMPTAGIYLKDVQLTARLEKNFIRIDSFRAASGPGHIEGTALLTLVGWRVTGYQGAISGENFQTVFFPEIQILSTPNLSFEGTPQKLVLRGELRLPELHIVEEQSHKVITPSSDVLREGRVVPAAENSSLDLDVQIRVLLGDQVSVKVAGIAAQLSGAMNLSFRSLDSITSKGEIKVVKGRYRTYGVNLEIIRGRLFFDGGPIDSPNLDFLALLTSGQAEILLDQIKNYLGLSTLEIQGGVGETTSSMGYKPLQITPPGTIPAEQRAGITDTVLIVGKYLTPQLYISFGKSLFTGSNLFRLRYDIFKQWQIETQTGGGESGIDLYYKLEFK